MSQSKRHLICNLSLWLIKTSEKKEKRRRKTLANERIINYSIYPLSLILPVTQFLEITLILVVRLSLPNTIFLLLSMCKRGPGILTF